MEIRFAHSLYQALRGDRFAFGYSGDLHDEHTARLITLGEAALEESGSRSNVRGRLAFVMVEAFQNIIRHRAALPEDLERSEGRSMFLLRCQEDAQQVVVWNPVRKGAADGLRTLLKRLQGLGASGLKELFLSGLHKENDGQRRGAGLGLIEMARRSGNDLGYRILGLGADFDLFVLAVRMGKDVPCDDVLNEGAGLRAAVVEQDVLLFHKGEPSAAVAEALLNTIEKDLDRDDQRRSARARAFLAGAGCLDQELQVSGTTIFVLAREGSRYVLIHGRTVAHGEQDRLRHAVERVNSWDRMKLEKHYRDTLLGRGEKDASSELVELARLSAEPVEYAEVPVEGGMLALVRTVI